MSRLAAGPEFDLIRKMLAGQRTAHPLVKVGPGDDCAIINDLALSTDASLEGVHFRRDWITAEEIGWRACAGAISDLAAMAAEPVAVLVSVTLPENDAGEFATSLMSGVIAAAESVGATVAGGDTSRSTQLMIDVIAVGRARAPTLRSHARIGDEVWVTGRLGGAAAAVHAWTANQQPNDAARIRYARPRPRTAEAVWLQQRGCINAAIDLSDGLYGDLRHIAAASNCMLVADADAVPVDADANASFEQAVGGGEDYEIAFTAPSGSVDAVREEFIARFNIELTRIGRVQSGSGVHERLAGGETRAARITGYQHFKANG